MKFGDHLSKKIHEPWHLSYLLYNELKVELKRRQLERGWTATDEVEFSKNMESELQKVYQFIERGLQELVKRTETSEQSLKQLSSNSNNSSNSSNSSNNKEIRKRYDVIADTLTEILFDANDLAKFHQLNATGFEKIIKKHDKWTHLDLRSHYRNHMSQQWSLDKLSLQFDVLIVKISELHDICHLHGNPRASHHTRGGDQTAFERATAKYWIHPDNITEVKSIILFHLPVHVYNQQKQYESSDMAVSSVYFDNDEFDLYSGRLSREEGAEAIRLRWYGQDSNIIYVERKTHKAAWLDGKSVKDRFRLESSQVDSFLSSQYRADQLAEDLRAKGTTKEEQIEESRFVASGVQSSVKTRHLKPVCRVFYNRTAFQLPGDQKLRISLDSNLTFIKETGGQQWRRQDIGIDYPFRQVTEQEISRFPYAVLETKLQTHLGQECPAWLTDLINSHLVHEVPRFSKYLHGASMLFQDKVLSSPYWLEEYGQDIRKVPITNIGLSRSMSFKPLVNGHHRQSLLLLHENEMNGVSNKKKKFSKSISLGDLRLSSILGPDLIPSYKRKSQQEQERQNPPHLSINLLAAEEEQLERPKSAVPRDILSRLWNYGGGNTPLSSSFFNGSSNKKEAPLLPRTRSSPERLSRSGSIKKIEPKTFFANERTFISWLQFCALLLTVALNLLNNGDHISRVIGAVFIIIASLLSFYALARFQIRSWQLRTNRQVVRYDDVWGPTVLCVLLVTALVANFYLRADTLSSSYQEPVVTKAVHP